jgi:hypothetical protein
MGIAGDLIGRVMRLHNGNCHGQHCNKYSPFTKLFESRRIPTLRLVVWFSTGTATMHPLDEFVFGRWIVAGGLVADAADWLLSDLLTQLGKSAQSLLMNLVLIGFSWRKLFSIMRSQCSQFLFLVIVA